MVKKIGAMEWSMVCCQWNMATWYYHGFIRSKRCVESLSAPNCEMNEVGKRGDAQVISTYPQWGTRPIEAKRTMKCKDKR